MMLAKCLAVIFLTALAVAQVPSFIPICGRRNPNRDKCILEAMNTLRDRIKTGIPEINLMPHEPRYIEGFTFANTNAIKVFLTNVTIRGMGDFIAETVQMNFEAHELHTVIRFKKIMLDGEYDANIKLIIPIVGHGPFHVEADDIVVDMVMKYNFVNINGADHVRCVSANTSLTVKNWSLVFEPSETIDSTLIIGINALLEEARNEMYEILKPNIERDISQVTMEVTNKVCESISYDELFPDRE